MRKVGYYRVTDLGRQTLWETAKQYPKDLPPEELKLLCDFSDLAFYDDIIAYNPDMFSIEAEKIPFWEVLIFKARGWIEESPEIEMEGIARTRDRRNRMRAIREKMNQRHRMGLNPFDIDDEEE